jgi:hypothetical protein
MRTEMRRLPWAMMGLAGLAVLVSIFLGRPGESPPRGRSVLSALQGAHAGNQKRPDPRGPSPVIDGTITAEEWKGARRESFSDGSELFLLRLGEELFLGIRARTEGLIAGNVYVESVDGVTIHHASAALGTAVYRKNGDVWRLVRNFSWRCRGAGADDAAEAEREAFFREEGWIASTSWMGVRHELEYRIRTGISPVRLAVVSLRASDPNVRIRWPADLEDDCVKPTPKGLPPTLSFDPDKWAILTAVEASPRRAPSRGDPGRIFFARLFFAGVANEYSGKRAIS